MGDVKMKQPRKFLCPETFGVHFSLKGCSINSPQKININKLWVYIAVLMLLIFSMHLAVFHSVTMPALLLHSWLQSAKENSQNHLKGNL